MRVATRMVTGIEVPDTAVVNAALEYAKARCEPFLFHHVARSWLFAVKIAKAGNVVHDGEVLAVSTLLHDLGLVGDFAGPRRFEVEGADEARAFAKEHGLTDQQRQLVWDSIALHTTPSISWFKEAEVNLASQGISLDYAGRGFESHRPEELALILEAYPRLDMKAKTNQCFCNLAIAKPETSYDNFLQDYAERCVPGYKNPLNLVDLLMNSPFDE